MARKYTKSSSYWDARKAAGQTPIFNINPPAQAAANFNPAPFPEINYGGEVALAADISGGASQSVQRSRQINSALPDAGAFQNIGALPSPYVGFTGGREYAGAADAINLCAKAWAGIAIIRNAIEVAVEFSCQPLFVKSENATVKTFFQEWFKAVQMNKLMEQALREYYRSGNVFLYRFDGQFGPAYYDNFKATYGAKANRVPIRYELLNPSNVFVPSGLSFPYTYVRLLSTYECERLRNPVTEQDKQVYKDLPPEAKQQIKMGATNPMGVYLQMDPKRLRFFFYKKQDYEPLAVPMVWPVLPDVEWKLTLTKMDKALARTIEHAILLITMGEAPNQYNGGNGINQNNIARVQSLMNNPTIGRVLVADYTVKGQWLVPPIQEILGPEKYQVVDNDIREGLQSILSGNDKFANAQMKAKIFIQRLEEGQNRFLNDFLMPEIKKICETMNFRSVPEIGFQPIDLQDEAVMSRIFAQLGQLGILTAEQVVEAIQTQVLPNPNEMKTGQEEYKKQRESGLYNPLLGGKQEDKASGGPNGRPGGTTGIKQSTTRKVSPIGTSKAEAFSLKNYTTYLKDSNALTESVTAALKKRFKVKGGLNEVQERAVNSLVSAIIAVTPPDQWNKSVAGFIENPPAIPTEIGRELDEIAMTYDVDSFDAAILRHCRTEAPKE